jgi:hypothetical protein
MSFKWGLQRGPLSLVTTIEELLERKSSGSGLENRDCGRRDSSRWPRGTLYPQKLAVTSLTNGGRSVGIVLSRTQATKFSLWGLQSDKRRETTRNFPSIEEGGGVRAGTHPLTGSLHSLSLSFSDSSEFPANYRDNIVQVNRSCSLWDPQEISKYTLWVEFRVTVC